MTGKRKFEAVSFLCKIPVYEKTFIQKLWRDGTKICLALNT